MYKLYQYCCILGHATIVHGIMEKGNGDNNAPLYGSKSAKPSRVPVTPWMHPHRLEPMYPRRLEALVIHGRITNPKPSSCQRATVTSEPLAYDNPKLARFFNPKPMKVAVYIRDCQKTRF